MERNSKRAILIAMAEEPPFSEIKSAIHPELMDFYKQYGFDVFYVYGESACTWERRLRRVIEEVRWGRFHKVLRLYDLLALTRFRTQRPKFVTRGNEIHVNVPEDIRHLSIKILSALEHLASLQYETIVRTTVSSVFNPELLWSECEVASKEKEVFYGGRLIKQSDGFQFISGSFTLLNKNGVNFLSEVRNKLDFSLVDDVCFGRAFQRSQTKMHDIPSENLTNISDIPSIEIPNSTVHFRCRTGIHIRNDIPVMKNILQLIKSQLMKDSV